MNGQTLSLLRIDTALADFLSFTHKESERVKERDEVTPSTAFCLRPDLNETPTGGVAKTGVQ